MNTTVSGTNVSLTTTAPTNMQISSDLVNWSNGTISNTVEAAGYSPASTADGKTFYALTSTEGLDVHGGIASSGNTVLTFSSVPHKSSSKTYYIEKPLYIRASDETGESELEMCLERLNVSAFDPGSSGVYDAELATKLTNICRVSITQVSTNAPVTEDGFTGTGVVTVNDDGSISREGATLTESEAVIYKYDTETAVRPIAGVNASGTEVVLGTDTAIAAAEDSAKCFVVDATGGKYSTIIVRIWLEGQHEKCLNDVSGQTIDVGLVWKVKSS